MVLGARTALPSAALALALLASCAEASALQLGLTLRTYANTALYGPAASTAVVSAAACAVPAGGAPLSAELVGTLSFPAEGGVFHFNCSWTDTTVGFVWIDGHMVCQDGHAYHPDSGTTDNPLSINTFSHTKGAVSSLPFRAHVYYSGNSTEAHVGVSVTWAALSAAHYAGLLGQAAAEAETQESEAAESIVEHMLAEVPHVAIPVAALGPDLPPAEQQRDELQRGLASGWGSWLHENILPVIKLPEAVVIAPVVCSKSTGKCLDSCVPDGMRPYSRLTDPIGVETRVGHQ